MASFSILTLAVLFITVVSGTHLTNKIFKWTHSDPVGYTSVGQELIGHWFYKSTKRDVRLCAYVCLRSDTCKSFNYNKATGECTLNRKAHDTVSLIPVSSDISYHAKEEFSIDPEALGPCAGNVCNGHGRCLETKTPQDELIAFCLCSKGWAGHRCDIAESIPSWGAWESWDECSVSCDRGYRLRTRNCEDSNNGQTLSPMECYGRDIEYEACQMMACPRWDPWGTWDECTTYQTCGRGYKVRQRTCNNGGVPGVDRYCLGPTNETTVCYGMNCKGPVRLRGGTAYGEGRVEIFNDKTREWGLVCGDQWSQPKADLVCKSLGMPGAFQATTDSRFGTGDGMFGVTSLTCVGSERTVQMCERNPWSLQSTCTEAALPGGVMCKVNGVWSLWAEWGDCSVTCEDGIRQRTRSCNHPPALHGGRDCVGESLQTKPCTLDMCPVDGSWRAWSDWSTCSKSCGKGSQWRERTCKGPFYDGMDCQGENRQTQECEIRRCPVDGVWNGWETWGDCTEICGGGVRERTRTCNGPFHEGAPCPGDTNHSEECNQFECPVDGQWLPWHDWRDCSVTCGGGKQIRKRDCLQPQYGGSHCEGESQETRECQTQNCPVDGVWREWNEWSACSHRCGTGTQTRNRTCDGPYFGGRDCVGPSMDMLNCNTHSCAVDGVWQSWSVWSLCTVTCGGSTLQRSRSCDGPYFGGKNCNGSWIEERPCGTDPCPIDGEWEGWSEWGTCNVTCGGGSQSRTRMCVEPKYGGKICYGDSVQLKDCNDNPCPIDGVFHPWEEWGPCSLSCGGGEKLRNRKCFGPFHGGSNCSGSWDEKAECNTTPCPVDGVWLSWGEFSECDLTCGGGLRSRRRECDAPQFGGAHCEGSAEEQEMCNAQNCPVDGEWQSWSLWETCSLTCGGGIQWRDRECMGPFWGGLDCFGNNKESRDCNSHNCPVDGRYNDWSDWGECSTTCGGGQKWRQRTCNGPFFGGADCEGPSDDSTTCNDHDCPVDGIWAEWAKWNTCTLTCGGGTQWRTRNCIGPFDGGKDCEGPRNTTQACNTQNCPIDGVWLNWGKWGACNTTCGGGYMKRLRVCEAPQYGGADCEGDKEELQSCSPNPCPIPGDWVQWEMWSACSVTCGGGKKSRSRVCNMTSHGDLTAQCEGPEDETVDCHTFACTPLARTCSEWGNRGLTASTMADIDPDEQEGPLEPTRVYCDMTSENGVGVTVIGHQAEEEQEVVGYEGAGEYVLEIEYNITLDHTIAVIDASENCRQFVRWKCKAALIHNPNGEGQITTGWRNRTGGIADYFGDAAPGSGMCTCGMDNSCADDEELACNCDKNDDQWREDSGYLSYKADLPVTEFMAGDTGADDEEGFATVGRILCTGVAT